LTKLNNDERPYCRFIDDVVFAFTRTNSSYRTVQPLATGKMRTANLRDVQMVNGQARGC